MPIVKFKKLDPTAFVPTQMTEGSVGFDLAVLNATTVLPGQFSSQPCIAHTGIAMELPKGYYAEVVIRSSLGRDTKIRLANQVGIIDSDYRGEILLYLENLGHHMEMIPAGKRIAQLIIHKIENFKAEEVHDLSSTARGTKGTGTT